jgi:ribosome-associated translation inhibitor RaiA
MQQSTTPAADTQVVLRSRNIDLGSDLRSRATDRAARLLSANPHIHQIAITLERATESGGAGVMAKAEVMFGGPALLTSVTADDAARALDYLLEKVEHQMRRQRAPRQALLTRRPPPPRGALAPISAGAAAPRRSGTASTD